MLVPRREMLLASVGLSALLATPTQAQTAFTAFSFSATGAPGSRTMPDRLADVKNVKDFGALGDDSHDDTTNIQAAVNWTASANRGTIFFPTGKYKITAPITFNASGINIRFLGEGLATLLDASSFASGGYVLDRSLGSPSNTGQVVIEGLSISGDASVSGSIRVGSCNSVAIRDCYIGGSVTTEDSPGNSSQNVLVETCKFTGGNDGLVMGGIGAVLGCDFVNYNVAARMYGNGWIMSGNRIENCNTAYLIGLDSSTAATLTSATVSGGTLSFASASGTVKIGQQLADLLSNVPQGVSILSGSGTTWQLSGPSFTVSTPQTITTVGNDQGASGFAILGGSLEGNWVSFDFGGTCNGFYLGSFTILGHNKTNAGKNPTSAQNTQYGIFVRANKASNGTFSGISIVGADIAGVEVDAATSRGNLLFTGISATASPLAGVNWTTPGNAYTAIFQSCNVDPIWTFSQLPSGGNVFEGDEFNISDSTTNTWGANVTVGSGSDHVLVRYNGSNWTVVAK